jgi:hypothetical protein
MLEQFDHIYSLLKLLEIFYMLTKFKLYKYQLY